MSKKKMESHFMFMNWKSHLIKGLIFPNLINRVHTALIKIPNGALLNQKGQGEVAPRRGQGGVGDFPARWESCV